MFQRTSSSVWTSPKSSLQCFNTNWSLFVQIFWWVVFPFGFKQSTFFHRKTKTKTTQKSVIHNTSPWYVDFFYTCGSTTVQQCFKGLQVVSKSLQKAVSSVSTSTGHFLFKFLRGWFFLLLSNKVRFFSVKRRQKKQQKSVIHNY